MARKSKGPKKPASTFTAAPAVEELAGPIIEQHHKHLIEHDIRVEFLFRSDTPKKGGKSVAGKAQKVTSLAAFFGRAPEATDVKPFFAIVISEPIWKYFDAAQRLALIDHELCHCGSRKDMDGNTVLYMIPHDLEEFRAVVERHGHWQTDVKQFAKSLAEGQTAMELQPAAAEVPKEDPVKAVAQELVDGVRADLERQSEEERYRDCPECQGLARRRGQEYVCRCGFRAAVHEPVAAGTGS